MTPSPSAIELRVIEVDDWPLWRTLRLQALAEAPYAFSSTLAEWQGEGDTEARWRVRLSTVAFNVVAFLDTAPAGMASGTGANEGEVDLISMWVAPFARGRGVGDSLVAAVIASARERGARRVALAVYESNDQAEALYRRHGFVDAGPLDGEDCGTAPERRMVRDLENAAQ